MADYCTDTFKMVEDTDDSFRLWQGLVGPYYVPIMSNDGTLRWTNNGGLPNPSEVNLMGPQGAGIRIAGIRESAEELPATAPAGDIWLVGEGSPYEGYSYTGGEWLDLGPLTVGPAGPPGPQGDDYELTEADKQEIAEISEGLFLSELDNDPLAIRFGGTGAHDLAGAKENLGIDDIEDKLGTWPLGTDAQDVAGAINEMIGEIALQVADIEQLKDNFAGEFSPTSTYAVGAYVVYGGAFWRCTTAVTTAGSWTGASNWTQVTAGGEFEALATLIASAQAALEALSTALSGKVSKAGDTMSGNLNLNNSSLDISTTPSETAWGNAYYTVRDKNGNDIGRFRAAQFSDGRCGVQILGRNGSVENALRLLAKQDGTIQVLVSDSAAWRAALGLNAINNIGAVGTGGLRIDFLNGTDQYYMPFYAGASENNKITLFDKNWNVVWKIPRDYKANDTYQTTASIILPGVADSSSKNVYFTMPIPKSMENISTVTVTSFSGWIAGPLGPLNGSSANVQFVNASGYTLSCIKLNDYSVRITLTKSTAFTNSVNNGCMNFLGQVSVRFT